MSTTFPVFEDGEPERELRTPDGFRPRGQGAAMDSEFFHYQDPAAKAAERDRRFEELARQANPELYDARQALLRSMRTAADWLAATNDLRRVVSQKVSNLHGTSADAPVGTSQERAWEVKRAQEQLAEAEQELEAAGEEFSAAKAAVAALTGGK
jgi:hypothetical protein